MTNMLRAGATFRVKNRDIENHVWVVVSEPAQNPDKVLIANLTSWSTDKDQSCVLEPSEHPFLKHRTCVYYRESKIRSAETIQQGLDAHVLQLRDNVSPRLLKKIRQGAAVSQFIPFDNLQLLKDQNLV